MAPAPDTPISPLKQVNRGPLKSKISSTWYTLTSNPALFKDTTQTSVSRFFLEFYCLGPNTKVMEEALNGLSTEDLVGPYKNNIIQFFSNSVKILKESPKEDSRRDNVVETLIPFLRNVLGRKFGNFSFDVMTLLGGSLERSDAVFTDLVSAIDSILSDVEYHTELRHRTLQLALTLVASINQDSINAFFLRRDLFSTLVKFMSDPATSPFAFESALLLGLLANFRKYEARNPYLVRIEDFVEEGVMKRIIEVVSAIAVTTRDSYTAITDDLPPSFVASLTSLVFSLRLSDFFTGFTLSLPPPPPPHASAPSVEKGKGKEQSYEEPSGSPADAKNGEPSNGATEPSTPTKPTSATSTPGTTTPNTPVKEQAVVARKEAKAREESAFKSMPPELVVILLPFYDLLNSNKVFCGLIFTESALGPSPLPPALISLSSYIFCHAAISERARCYARLCLIILTILVEEGEGKLTAVADPIRLCRQRQPMLPYTNEKRPPMAAMLDSAVIFLRHNLHKRLDAESYMFVPSPCSTVWPALTGFSSDTQHYNWVVLWRSILSLSAFVVSKIDDLRQATTKLDDLISQIFIVVSYAAYWGESFFPNTEASVLLHYELLHAESVLDSLSDLLGISSHSLSAPPLSPQPSHPRETPARSLFFLTSPRRMQFGLASDGPPSFFATECVSNIRSIITFFTTKIDALRGASEDEVEAEQVMEVIEKHLGELELIDASAMGDLRRYHEAGSHEAFFKKFSEFACADVLAIIPKE
ncbi:hypothetical protein MNV49_002530 [Pseudohyphozyma bogoriensis]|nr:hypothetical protein MNV49_002530 [Pseudohyphozyma bogoriensis]